MIDGWLCPGTMRAIRRIVRPARSHVGVIGAVDQGFEVLGVVGGWERVVGQREARDRHLHLAVGQLRLVQRDVRSQDCRALADSRSLAFGSASTSSVLVMLERPLMPSRVASSYRCFLEAFASTPPAVGRSVSTPPSACWSDGPRRSFGSQWSPTFSCVCFRALKATRCARSSSPYCSAAESCALAKVR